MNKDALQKELQEQVREGRKPSDIKRDRQVQKESDRILNQPKGSIPTPPPMPPKQEETNQPKKKGWSWKFWQKDEKKKQEEIIKKQTETDLNNQLKNLGREDLETNFLTLYETVAQLQQEKDNWELNTGKFKEDIEKLADRINDLQEENKELRQKLNIEPLRPQPRNLSIMNERDQTIIQQAAAHVEPLTNSTTLRARILKAEELGTKDAYWELQKDLREPGEISNKLLQFFQQDSDQVISFNYTLAAILRGGYLNDK